jgi:ribosomal protein S25
MLVYNFLNKKSFYNIIRFLKSDNNVSFFHWINIYKMQIKKNRKQQIAKIILKYIQNRGSVVKINLLKSNCKD